MNYNVVISDRAKKDLYRIYSYIFTVLKSKVNANSILKRLYEAIEKLNFMPNRYHRYQSEPWFSRGVRFFSVNNYSIFYVIDETTATVIIIHIIYGKRDFDKVLFPAE